VLLRGHRAAQLAEDEFGDALRDFDGDVAREAVGDDDIGLAAMDLAASMLPTKFRSVFCRRA